MIGRRRIATTGWQEEWKGVKVAVALLIDPDDRSVLAVRREHNVVVWREHDRIDLGEVLPDFVLTVAELFATLPVRRKPQAE